MWSYPASPARAMASLTAASTSWPFPKSLVGSTTWHTLRFIGTVGFALVAPTIAFMWPSSTDFVAAAAASVWLFGARALLGPPKTGSGSERSTPKKSLTPTYFNFNGT
jgi:hypothetical protein